MNSDFAGLLGKRARLLESFLCSGFQNLEQIIFLFRRFNSGDQIGFTLTAATG